MLNIHFANRQYDLYSSELKNKDLVFFVGSDLGSCSLVTVEIVSPGFSCRISITFKGEAQ
jgi:hypothetical protein